MSHFFFFFFLLSQSPGMFTSHTVTIGVYKYRFIIQSLEIICLFDYL